jgi:surface protein
MNNWDVSGVTTTSYMFLGASTFNQPIGNWDVSSVTNMGYMFDQVSAFNQSIGNWIVSSVTNMFSMFKDATSFNQPIGNWDVSSVSAIGSMFKGAFYFNQDISNWDISSVTALNGMFQGASSFNQPIGNWDVSGITDMEYLFYDASSFNQPISTWNTSSVTDMKRMFFNAFSFNQPISNWDVSRVYDMEFLFYNAYYFDQPIGNWDVSVVGDMREMFEGVTLSTANYDNLLAGWGALPLKNGVVFDGGYSLYSASTARQYLIDTFSWSITDGGFTPDTTDPVIDTPNEVTYQLGTTGNEISWTATDYNAATYTITVDGIETVSTSVWTSGIPVIYSVDDYSIGSYTVNITFVDASANSASDTVMVTVTVVPDTTNPVMDTPDDVSYELGTTGNTIIWNATDADPATYTITVDGTETVSATAWISGTPVSYTVDGYAIGSYTVIITFVDANGNSISDTVMVTVSVVPDTTDPVVDMPDNITYEVGATGNSIIWNATDGDAATYTITVDGTETVSATAWTSGTPVSYSVDDYTVGSYTVIITFFDASGNSVSDTVIVTVTEQVTTNSETTSNSTTSDATSDTTTSDTPSLTLGPSFTTFLLGSVIVFFISASFNKLIRKRLE